MKIGIDASRLSISKRTGTENYSWQITRGLLNHPSPHHFSLYFNQPPADAVWQEFLATPQAELRSIPFPRLWTHLRLSSELFRQPPDVLFVPAHVLPLYHPSRSVVTIHDLGYLYYPEAHTHQARLYLDYSTRFSAKQASRIIAVSETTRQALIRHYQLDPAKIVTVHHGFDQQHFQPVLDPNQLEAVRQRYQLGAGPYLLFVGTVQPRKNLIRLLDAFAQLLADTDFQRAYPEYSQLQLVIGGKLGWLSDPITRHLQHLNLATQVKLSGYIEDNDLPALISGAVAFVMPSLYEGFGLPVLEALACGTPVICSNTGSLPEIVDEAALLHNPLDIAALTWNLQLLLTSTTLQKQLRSKGLERARNFSWERCTAETLAVLENS
jgi:glycosyltransferase involved in cell wall biosynthesis